MKYRNYAHRGFSKNYPENTMLAFEQALKAGCEGIELDVQLTKDGHLVIIHDETIDRTSDQSGRVCDLTLEELRRADFSYRYRKTAGFQPIPTLSEYFELVRDRDIITNIEMKNNIYEYPGLEETVLKKIRKYRLEDKVIISSFNHWSVVKMKSLAPEIVCAFLSDKRIPLPGNYVHVCGSEAYHPQFRLLKKEELADLRKYDVRINVWTVNRRSDILRMIALGVDGIISNDTELVTRILRETGMR